MFVNAQVLLVRCKKNRQTFGVRIEQEKGTTWKMTWAFPLTDERASHEGFGQFKLSVDCYATEEYPGCPHCKSTGYVRCGKCGKLTCWEGENTSTCAWCGVKLTDIAYRGAMDVEGGQY